MRSSFLQFLLLALISLPVRAQAPLQVATDITAQQVRDFLSQLPKNDSSDRPIRVIDAGGYRIGIYGVFRPASLADNATLHETRIAEIYYILEGSGTLVTGGKLKEPTKSNKSVMASMINVRSDQGIEGGVARHLGKGDMIIVPGGVPHWWSSRDGDLTYLIIRTDPAGELALK